MSLVLSFERGASYGSNHPVHGSLVGLYVLEFGQSEKLSRVNDPFSALADEIIEIWKSMSFSFQLVSCFVHLASRTKGNYIFVRSLLYSTENEVVYLLWVIAQLFYFKCITKICLDVQYLPTLNFLIYLKKMTSRFTIYVWYAIVDLVWCNFLCWGDTYPHGVVNMAYRWIWMCVQDMSYAWNV
jgi:hypothetical protein